MWIRQLSCVCWRSRPACFRSRPPRPLPIVSSTRSACRFTPLSFCCFFHRSAAHNMEPPNKRKRSDEEVGARPAASQEPSEKDQNQLDLPKNPEPKLQLGEESKTETNGEQTEANIAEFTSQDTESEAQDQNKGPSQDGGRSLETPSDPPNSCHHPGTSPHSYSLPRRWESCSNGESGIGFDFSVMSYNILSQDLLQENAYLYRHCPPALLAWDYRLQNLLAELGEHDADIMCLQEVQMDHYSDQIKPALQERGYHCEFKKRTGDKPDGCAVVFKSARFSLLSSNPVEFYRRGDPLLDRDNVGLVILLQPRSQSDRCPPLCVANTHLLYNPRRGDVKLAQLAILLAEIDRLSRLPDGSANPVLLCGDFNSVPFSPLYRFVTSGRLQYGGMRISQVSGQENGSKGKALLSDPIWSPSLGISRLCRYEDTPTCTERFFDPRRKKRKNSNGMTIEHRLNLCSTYQHRLQPSGHPEISTCHSRTAMTVDYILYSKDSGGRGLQPLRRLSLVGQSELQRVNWLPNRHHPSDHLPLLASFRLLR